jgi:HD-GYP domain-containing protein (c-di-GMP phosphodiesterase class II)
MNKKKVLIGELLPGMFVSELDRPWLETPFLYQGFVIESDKDIDKLAQHCKFVYIDEEKSLDYDFAATRAGNLKQDKSALYDGPAIPYEKSSSFKEELESAREAHDRLTATYEQIYADIQHNNKLDLVKIKEAMAPMVDSVIRNPDAFILLTQLKQSDSYAYNHAMSCSVLAVALGRHIGLPRLMIRDLALGALLFDVGRAHIPKDLLSAPRKLSDEEMAVIRQHVETSLNAVAQNPGASQDVLDMVATHHERHDGSGYPRGLKGDQIPLYGKIAGIVDSYDAITSKRPYADPLSSYEAARELYEWRDKAFQAALVEQFIQVIGIYTMGTIVELSDGRVGVVSAQHREARMRPVVTVLLNRDKEFLDEFEEVDLRKERLGQDQQELKIARSLPKGSYDIDPAEFFL